MKEDLAENYTLLKWCRSQTNPDAFKNAIIGSIIIFGIFLLTEYFMTLGDERVVLEEVKLSHQSNYEAVNQEVSVFENPYGKPVLVIEKKMNLQITFVKCFIMSAIAFIYIVTQSPKNNRHEPDTGGNGQGRATALRFSN